MSANDPARPRRAFLRDLVSLPLIGGAVSLIGSPSAVAAPVTDDLLNAYDEWLDLERSFLKWERHGPAGINSPDRATFEVIFRNRSTGELFDYRPCSNVIGARHGGPGDRPSSRAALVLSAVGAGWERGR